MNRDLPFPDDLGAEQDARELRAVWDLLDRAAEPLPLTPEETDRALATVTARLAVADTPRGAVRSAWTAARRYTLRAAAVAAVAVGVSAAWYAIPVTVSAGPANRLAVTLPDGSLVELNAGSTLSYRRGFSFLPGISAGSRATRLEGEAFFRVEPGVRPFRVRAGGADVRVLGTRFNVRARPGTDGDPGTVRVEVEEGRVEVWGGGDRSVILGAGQAARLDPGTGSLDREEMVPGRVAAWRSGGLTAVDEPLVSILRELELRFGVGIVLVDPAVGSARLSVYYPELESLESVLSDLATQQELRYRRTNDGWELF